MHADDLCLCLGNGVVSQVSFVTSRTFCKVFEGVIDVSDHMHAYMLPMLLLL